MRYRLIFLLCLLLSLCGQTHAAPIEFYGASVPVASQSSRERSKAAKEGLSQVLIRISGSKDVAISPSVRSSLSRASKYLEQYHYQLIKLDNGDKEERLAMTFSASVVARILKEAKEPIWPTNNRPKVLVWLVEDQAEVGKQFINNTQTTVAQGVGDGSVARGMPIVFPLLDLEDQLAISEDQVWSLDEDAILQASERYHVDTILVGRYTQTSQGLWRGTWQFFHRSHNQVYDMRSEVGEELGVQAVDHVADYLAQLYAIVPNAEAGAELYMRVSGVEGFKSYRGILNYLKGVTVITSYDMVSITDDAILLGLHLSGNLNQLNNAISLDDKIKMDEVSSTTDTPWVSSPEGTLEQPLKFRWVGG